MPELRIQLVKEKDGSILLRCHRADGTTTWQRNDGSRGRFFVVHDLTHFAVETILGHRRGFWGLVTDGWNVTDFGAPWPRGPIPADMDPSELIVGFLDAERAGGTRWTAEDFNDKAKTYFASHGIDKSLTLADADLDAIRARVLELADRWALLPRGEILELEFDRARFTQMA
jgi:hypothetical protein